MSPRGDSSPLSGWTLQRQDGTLVAGHVLVARGPVSSQTVAPGAAVRLPPGRYRLTRLSQTGHRFEIPIRGLRPTAVKPAERPAVTARFDSQQSSGPSLRMAALSLGPRDRLMLEEVRQEASQHLELATCVDDHCSRVASDPDPGSTYPYAPQIEYRQQLTGHEQTTSAVAVGLGGALGGTRVIFSTA